MADENKEIKTEEQNVLNKCNSATGTIQKFLELFTNAAGNFGMYATANKMTNNMASIQNRRVKAINTLPFDLSKTDIENAIKTAYQSEKKLRQIANALKINNYPFQKIIKTYQDIPSYKYFYSPLYITEEDAKSENFKRESILLDKISKTIGVKDTAHKIVGQALTQGKVFYYLRHDIDKSHNKVNFITLQQLPQDYCTIIGFNNISKYTISFNLMYFLESGTDFRQYGDLFKPYMEDFNQIFEEKSQKGKKVVYAEKNCIKCRNGKVLKINRDNLNRNGFGEPDLFTQNGRWFYNVSLPVEKIWTFEIDDTMATTFSIFTGLFLTYNQQSDYEAAQLELLLNPLVKIFTGEIPYFNDNGVNKDDNYKLSPEGRQLFEILFDALMAAHNTSGTAFFSAPVENLRSHDFAESANANEIATTFNRYEIEKTGLSGILPAVSDPKAGVADLSAKLESAFCGCVYTQFSNMMTHLFEELNLKYEWKFTMFGSIYTDQATRDNAINMLKLGDTTQYYILAALDNTSLIEKECLMSAVKASGILEKLSPPQSTATLTSKDKKIIDEKQAGRPQEDVDKATSESRDYRGVTE